MTLCASRSRISRNSKRTFRWFREEIGTSISCVLCEPYSRSQAFYQNSTEKLKDPWIVGMYQLYFRIFKSLTSELGFGDEWMHALNRSLRNKVFFVKSLKNKLTTNNWEFEMCFLTWEMFFFYFTQQNVIPTWPDCEKKSLPYVVLTLFNKSWCSAF